MLCYNMAHPVTRNDFTQTASSIAKYTSQKKSSQKPGKKYQC